jgi:hypothetical protein
VGVGCLHCFGAVGNQGSIAVTERAILTLKHEWLRRVPVIKGLDHLRALLIDFEQYYNGWRGHTTLGGIVRGLRRGLACKPLPGRHLMDAAPQDSSQTRRTHPSERYLQGALRRHGRGALAPVPTLLDPHNWYPLRLSRARETALTGL